MKKSKDGLSGLLQYHIFQLSRPNHRNNLKPRPRLRSSLNNSNSLFLYCEKIARKVFPYTVSPCLVRAYLNNAKLGLVRFFSNRTMQSQDLNSTNLLRTCILFRTIQGLTVVHLYYILKITSQNMNERIWVQNDLLFSISQVSKEWKNSTTNQIVLLLLFLVHWP